MLRSMTAYGRKKMVFEDIEILIELQSINKKHLEIQIKAPHEFLSFDCEIRKTVSELIFRGHINVHVTAAFKSASSAHVTVNIPLATEIKNAISHLCQTLGLVQNRDEESLHRILLEKGVLQIIHEIDDISLYQEKLSDTLKGALQNLLAFKEKEGRMLLSEFKTRLVLLSDYIKKVSENSDNATNRHRLRLNEILETENTSSPDLDERIAREIALLAEKLDISEEISRFCYHLQHFEEVMMEEGVAYSKGKTLEFILQELQREINTISSKSQDVHISKQAILMKSLIEQMREQVQNVE